MTTIGKGDYIRVEYRHIVRINECELVNHDFKNFSRTQQLVNVFARVYCEFNGINSVKAIRCRR